MTSADTAPRFASLTKAFKEHFGVSGGNRLRCFSSPGRTELCGNHTDHNHGRVLAASIDLDCRAVVSAADDTTIRIHDITYKEDFSVTLCSGGDSGTLSEPRSASLIRGIADYLHAEGYKVGGFSAAVESRIPAASGVSSSAAFEMLITTIFNALYNGGAIPLLTRARAGQYAERNRWGKTAGLMDQLTCAHGALVAIDFSESTAPRLTRVPFDFSTVPYAVLLVNTGTNHAALDAEYSAINTEMKAAASILKRHVLGDVSVADIVSRAADIRAAAGDRAFLRALHFAGENRRVDNAVSALERADFPAFLAALNASGNSSWKLLQNVTVPGADGREQSVAVSLALTEEFIAAKKLSGLAAVRVHGGGFAGVIQVILPEAALADYTAWIGTPPYVLHISSTGAGEVSGD